MAEGVQHLFSRVKHQCIAGRGGSWARRQRMQRGGDATSWERSQLGQRGAAATGRRCSGAEMHLGTAPAGRSGSGARPLSPLLSPLNLLFFLHPLSLSLLVCLHSLSPSLLSFCARLAPSSVLALSVPLPSSLLIAPLPFQLLPSLPPFLPQ